MIVAGRPRSLAAPAAVVSTLLATIAVLDVVRVWAFSTEASILRAIRDGRPFSITEARASDDRLTALAGWSLVLLVACGIAWCVWQHRARSNLSAMGRRQLRFSPAWSVGVWFVPIVSLWMPFQAVRELWKASAPDAGELEWLQRRTWPALGWWWACWLASGVTTFMGTALRGDDLASSVRGDTLMMMAAALRVAAAVLAIWIVRRVVARQIALAGSGAGIPPVPSTPPMPPMPSSIPPAPPQP